MLKSKNEFWIILDEIIVIFSIWII